MDESERNELALPIDMQGCARCHGDGHKIVFRPLDHPVECEGEPPLTHWALCPDSEQPILMRFSINNNVSEPSDG